MFLEQRGWGFSNFFYSDLGAPAHKDMDRDADSDVARKAHHKEPSVKKQGFHPLLSFLSYGNAISRNLRIKKEDI